MMLVTVKVISPGSGLGRLPLEICLRGYQSMGNEFSYFMLILSNFILNKYVSDDYHTPLTVLEASATNGTNN